MGSYSPPSGWSIGSTYTSEVRAWTGEHYPRYRSSLIWYEILHYSLYLWKLKHTKNDPRLLFLSRLLRVSGRVAFLRNLWYLSVFTPFLPFVQLAQLWMLVHASSHSRPYQRHRRMLREWERPLCNENERCWRRLDGPDSSLLSGLFDQDRGGNAPRDRDGEIPRSWTLIWSVLDVCC